MPVAIRLDWRVTLGFVAGLLGVMLTPPAVAEAPAEPQLVAHWPLAGGLRDESGHGHDGVAVGRITFAPGPDGQTDRAAEFDGRGAWIDVPPADDLDLGADEFSLALWVHTDEELDDDLGDLVSSFDRGAARGFHLSLRSNAGVTLSQPNARQLQFGIDNAAEPEWTDEGRPGNAVYGMSMAVHDDALYVGTCEAGRSESGHVFRYLKTGEWQDLAVPNPANAVCSLAVFQGSLYAGTGKYRLGGSSLSESENTELGGYVWRLEADGRWTACGRLPETEAVSGMVVYRGQLYAGSLYKPAGFFRYEGDERWTALPTPGLPTPGGKRVEALTVFDGYVWATSYDDAHVYRYDGQEWTDFGQVGDNTQLYAFAVYERRLSVSSWRSGSVFRLEDDGTWSDIGHLGQELEVMGMLVHNGRLYAGTLPLGQVYRYGGGQTWDLVGELDRTPDVKYRRVWSMAQYRGRLFCTTLPSGHVYSMQAGPFITRDRELTAGWHHIAAVRATESLRLYVDGQLVTESEPFDGRRFALPEREPLRIGAGTGDSFCGRLADVRLYRGALNDEQVRALSGKATP